MPRVEPSAFSLEPSRLIDPERLLAVLGDGFDALAVLAVDTCASTNALLVDRSPGDWPDAAAVLCVADRQSAGRGRRGRAWVSSPEGSLTFSLAWRFARRTDLSGLSLAAGLALRDGLAACGLAGVRLKWPNDLLAVASDGRLAKLGGILIELSADPRSVVAVVGVGLNLRAPDTDPGQPAIGLDALGPLPARHDLLASLVSALACEFGGFAGHGFAPRCAAWNAAHAFAGREVVLHAEHGAPVVGDCLGADTDGALRVRTAAGEMRWLAGDVSLRVAEGSA